METKNFKSKGSLSIVRSYYFPQNKKPNILQQKKNESVPTIKISKKEESFNRTACFFDPSTWDTSSKKEKKITKENGSLHFFKNPSEDEDGLKKITNVKKIFNISILSF